MNTTKVCVAGVGQKNQVWFGFRDNELVECSAESESGHQEFPFLLDHRRHFAVIRVDPKDGPRKKKIVCPYLTASAGKQAVQALMRGSLEGLAKSLTIQYGWQVANKAKALPSHGEIAKIYAENFAVYVFSEPTSRRSLERLSILPVRKLAESIR